MTNIRFPKSNKKCDKGKYVEFDWWDPVFTQDGSERVVSFDFTSDLIVGPQQVPFWIINYSRE